MVELEVVKELEKLLGCRVFESKVEKLKKTEKEVRKVVESLRS